MLTPIGSRDRGDQRRRICSLLRGTGSAGSCSCGRWRVIYLIAFLVAANQFRPLLGSRGILPIPDFVARCSLPAGAERVPPPLLRTASSPAWRGPVSSSPSRRSTGLVDRAPDRRHDARPGRRCGRCTCRSSTSARRGTRFGWETLLLEAGFLTIFLGPDGQRAADADPDPPALAAVPCRVRRRADQDARRPVLARPDLPQVPPRDPADARAAELVVPPPADAAPPGRGRRQPRRPARRPVPAVHAPAGRRRRRRRSSSSPSCG